MTAPSDAEDTSRAYFAITPDVYGGFGGFHRARLRASSAEERRASRRRFVTSNAIRSPSRSSAIGPPTAASGATCPAISPCVAPEKRPSVSNATARPSPSPTMAEVTPSISRIPGPPFGPSYRTTTTSPARMRRPWTARNASSSQSNTRAGPSNRNGSCPVIFATQPSGARLP